MTIATRQRPDSCQQLVAALLDQAVPQNWQVRLIIVDNEPGGSGLELPEDPRIELLHEPNIGIPFARNCAVNHALPWADIIAFIDDDEVPADALWLQKLVEGLDRYDADVVSGPVHPKFPSGTPGWISGHPVFARRQYRSGDALDETYTGNTAARATVFRFGQRFSLAFRETGGSDTELFRRLSLSGARIRWIEEATVEESVPKERACVRWILARSFRIGANRVQFLRATSGQASQWARVVLGSTAELLLMLVAPLVGVFSRRYMLILFGRSVRGIGAFAAILGVRPAPYK